MPVLNQIAYFQNRRDEVPNQELARRLADTGDQEGVREIAENLWNKNTNIQSDCLKVLYEIGYLEPSMIASFADDFLKMLHSRNNRLVWGGMIALSTIAAISSDVIYPHYNEIQKVMEVGSVITVDAGVHTLAGLASTSPERNKEIFPYLLRHMEICRPKDVPRHAEMILLSVNVENKREFTDILEKRMEDMTDLQVARLRRVINKAEKQ
jgi:hypothetical protein